MPRSFHADVPLLAVLQALIVAPLGLGCAGAAGSDEGEVPSFTTPPAAGAPATVEPSGAGGTPTAPTPSGAQGEPEQNPNIPLSGTDPLPAGNAAGGPVGGSGGAAAVPVSSGPPALERVLVFSRTAGYRHDAIGPGIQAIRALGSDNGFAVEATEDPARFVDENLAGFDVVVFLSTTGDVLNDEQQAAFERYIRAGGGWVGVHAAADTEYDWAWYGQLLGGGAYFESHPEIQTVQLEVEDSAHAATAHLPQTFELQDEWYNFRQNPRPSVSVLMTLVESSYAPGPDAMGDHPIAWFHELDGGRAFYTALGHRPELYQDPLFTQHLLGGIRWAAGVAP